MSSTVKITTNTPPQADHRPLSSRQALVLQHDPLIHLGLLGPLLERSGYEVTVIDVPVQDLTVLDPITPDLVVVLGGDISAYQTQTLPFLAIEEQMLTRRLDAHKPTLGICLGAQLMAAAAGGRAYRGGTPQVGHHIVGLTAAGQNSPLRHFEGVAVVQWHGDTFDPPSGATLLAYCEDFPHQAFALGDYALGLQFHPEVTDEMHEVWLRTGYNELESLGLDAEHLRQTRRDASSAAQTAARAALGEWLTGITALDAK